MNSSGVFPEQLLFLPVWSSLPTPEKERDDKQIYQYKSSGMKAGAIEGPVQRSLGPLR